MSLTICVTKFNQNRRFIQNWQRFQTVIILNKPFSNICHQRNPFSLLKGQHTENKMPFVGGWSKRCVSFGTDCEVFYRESRGRALAENHFHCLTSFSTPFFEKVSCCVGGGLNYCSSVPEEWDFVETIWFFNSLLHVNGTLCWIINLFLKLFWICNISNIKKNNTTFHSHSTKFNRFKLNFCNQVLTQLTFFVILRWPKAMNNSTEK